MLGERVPTAIDVFLYAYTRHVRVGKKQRRQTGCFAAPPDSEQRRRGDAKKNALEGVLTVGKFVTARAPNFDKPQQLSTNDPQQVLYQPLKNIKFQ